MLEHLVARSSFRQLVDQPERRIDERLRRVGVRFLPGIDLHLRGRDAGVGARANPQLCLLVLVHVLGCVIADVAMSSLHPGPAAEFAELVELRMGRLDMVGLVEGLHGDLPIAIEDAPLPPSVAHVLKLEGIEHGRGRLEIVAQGLAVGIHVDADPAAPGVDFDLAQADALVRQRPLPVRLVDHMRVLAIQVVPPAVVRHRRSGGPWPCRRRSWRRGSVHEPAAAMRAHIVVGADLVRRRAHDEDRVIEDVIGEVAADFGDFLDAADLLPHLAPQLVALRAGVVLGNVGFHSDGHRFGQLLGRFGTLVSFLISSSSTHDILQTVSQRLMAARKASSLRNRDVLSAPRCVHLRLSPPSTRIVWPVM